MLDPITSMESFMLETQRLVMRRWQETDREPYAALNADPEVTEFLSSALTPEQSDRMVDRIEAGFDRYGYGLWALEVRETRQFIGWTGLAVQTFEAHFTPAVEIGWRLARSAWGHGYATEAARAALAHGFEVAELTEIVSMTTVSNIRSRAVMERLGMTRDPADDFDYPLVPAESPVRHAVLYRLSADRWRSL
ncbi:GNAT family N-acetyltransferase [Streptosporangium sp. NPDC000563]|uniref:GNAT family N-acetyltransferase n=1 Tax=unclassified Streptosporangium TaxID=2632669 RepID=UPI00331B11AE